MPLAAPWPFLAAPGRSWPGIGVVARVIFSHMPRGTDEVSEPMYFVLAALLDGPLHGHAIMKVVSELSDGRVKPSVGTLYGILERLSDRSVIAVEREEIVNGRSRRYFRITDSGKSILEAEARRMMQAASLVVNRDIA